MSPEAKIAELEHTVAALTVLKDEAYRERDRCVAAIVAMAQAFGFPAGIGVHDPADKSWDLAWRYIVYIELPTGQLSWHIHQSELPLFTHLPAYQGKWDGHSTPEKYNRLAAFRPAHHLNSNLRGLALELSRAIEARLIGGE